MKCRFNAHRIFRIRGYLICSHLVQPQIPGVLTVPVKPLQFVPKPGTPRPVRSRNQSMNDAQIHWAHQRIPYFAAHPGSTAQCAMKLKYTYRLPITANQTRIITGNQSTFRFTSDSHTCSTSDPPSLGPAGKNSTRAPDAPEPSAVLPLPPRRAKLQILRPRQEGPNLVVDPEKPSAPSAIQLRRRL